MGLISSQGLALDQEFYDASRERGRNGIFRLRMDCQALIAIIDDEVSGRTALKRYLRAEGFAVKGHASATKFLHSFSERRPDCILLDLHMPGMDGFELLETLQTISASPPVIVVTADCSPPNISRTISLGALRCLNKPVDASILIEAINAALRR